MVCILLAVHNPRLKLLLNAFKSYNCQTHALSKLCTSKEKSSRENTRALIHTHKTKEPLGQVCSPRRGIKGTEEC